ncbi:MAG TPA: hypothetical protein VKA08_14270 [Balneolales bacterium]|nr:hypothetical protein [Balneolales bacterium]
MSSNLKKVLDRNIKNGYYPTNCSTRDPETMRGTAGRIRWTVWRWRKVIEARNQTTQHQTL